MTDTFFEVNLKANVVIESTQTFKDLTEKVGRILQIQFQKDDSGYTEECPSYICNLLHLAIRLTGNSYEDTNHFEKGNEFKSLSIQTFGLDKENRNVNIGSQLCRILNQNGIKAKDAFMDTNQWNFLNCS